MNNVLLIAVSMLWDTKRRSCASAIGIAVSFLLGVSQLGLAVGWSRTCTAIIHHADADIWVIPQHTIAFDYGTTLPEQRLYQVRNVPGVRSAEPMLLSWAFWKLANGKQQNVALIGVGERLAGAPWAMQEGQIDCLRRPNRVIVDDLFRDKLGITGVDDDAEVLQKNVIVGGLSRDVRTLTAAPHVFMALESLRECDPRLRTDDITYVLVRCVSPLSIQTVKECITAEVPGVEVLTSREFGVRTSRFWLLETGLGFTVALTAALGVLVGCVVSSQTLYAVTHDHLRDYATLLAVGFTRASVLQIVLVQAMLLGATGICVGTILFWWAVKATASTPVPIETTGPVYMSVTAACFGSAALAAWVSVRTIHRIDPISVFQ